MRNPRLTSRVCLSLALCLAAFASAASAQTMISGGVAPSGPRTFYTYEGDDEATWSKSIGNSTLGAELELTAGYWCNTEKRGVYGDVEGDVTLFGREYEAAGIHVQSYNTYSSGKSSVEVVVADSTVWDREYSNETKLFDWGYSDSVSRSYNFTIWIIPITVKIEAGFSAELGLTANTSLSGVGLDGYAAASAYGSASAGIGYSSSAFELSLTLRATLEFFDTRLEMGLVVAVGGMTGSATLEFDAVTLRLELVLTVRALWWDEEWKKEIVEKSYGSVDYTLFSF